MLCLSLQRVSAHWLRLIVAKKQLREHLLIHISMDEFEKNFKRAL
jgi:hypothetical protein